MSMQNEWQKQKDALSKVKVDVSLFKHDLGSKLGKFESARKAVDDKKANHLKTEPVMVKLRAELKTACDNVGPVVVEYEKNVKYLADHATSSAQKEPLTSCAAFLLKLAKQVGDARQL